METPPGTTSGHLQLLWMNLDLYIFVQALSVRVALERIPRHSLEMITFVMLEL